MIFSIRQLASILMVSTITVCGTTAVVSAKTYQLRADTTTITMPDKTVVNAWGFADDTPGTGDGIVKVPGPVLELPATDGNLTISLTNKLSVPVSVYIPGLRLQPSPVKNNSDGKGLRMSSFAAEAPAAVNGVAGPPVDFVFTGLRPGTHIYQSGTNPAAQIPMGLYGALIVRPAAVNSAYNDASSSYDVEQVVVLSEIDPAFNSYVSSTGSAVDLANNVNYALSYAPKYFLINGKSYPDTAASASQLTAPTGKKTLLRFVNAGVQNHVPAISGLPVTVLGEDGNLLTYPRKELAPVLPSGKSLDVILDLSAVPAADGNFFTLSDRRAWRTSSKDTTGSMIGFIKSYPAGMDCSPFKGDMNEDGQINVVDVLILLNKLVNNAVDIKGDVTPLSSAGLPCGKGTGALTLTDALYVLQKAMNIN